MESENTTMPGDIPPLPIGRLLAFHAAREPRHPAITVGDATITRAELEARSNRRARQLDGLGVHAGDVVTLALPNGVEFYETAFATWKLGATPNPVSARLPQAELRAIVALAQPRLLVGPESARLDGWAFLPAGCGPGADIDDAPLAERIASHWKIVTSGGSTGRPKLIVDQSPGVFSPFGAMLGQTPGTIMLNPGPLYHNAPFVMTSRCLFAGGHVVEMERFEPLRALELIERHRVEWVNFVPTMMHRIMRLPREQREAFDLSSLRVVFHMASACPAWLKEAWIDWLGADRIFELYGGTEGQGMTVISGTEWLAHKGSVGRLLPGSRMKIVGEDGEDCAPGAIGEIYFLPDGGPNSTYRYVGATPRTLDDWESLGDLGYLDEEGYLYLVERRTDLIISGGANIYPAEVEGALDEHPDVQSSIVIGLPDDDLGQRVHAIVQVSPQARSGTGAAVLEQFVATRLARYKVPRTFEFTNEFLRDDAGKARRAQLREQRIAAPPETGKNSAISPRT